MMKRKSTIVVMSLWWFLLPNFFLGLTYVFLDAWGTERLPWRDSISASALSPRVFLHKGGSGWVANAGMIPQEGLTRFTYGNFGSQRLNEHLGWYLHQVAVDGPPDILIVGSSRALQGVDPLALRKALSDRGLGQLRVYNFGINGATAQVVDVLIRDILTPEQLPRLILWADGARAFNSGRRDRTYESIMASEGYQLLLAGVRPSVLPWVPHPEQCYDVPPLPWAEEGSLISRSLGAPCLLPPISERHQVDWVRKALATMQAHRALTDLTPLGFLPVSQRFDPQTYYRQHPRIAGQFDGDYVGFDLQGSQAIAVRRLLEYIRTRQIPVVFVNLPLTTDYLDPVRLRYEGQFHRALQRWSSDGLHVVNFVTPELKGLQQPHYFADPSHINAQGAIAVSDQLAQLSYLPWPTRE